MFETLLLIIIILVLGLMAVGYLIEVGGVFASIGWGVALVCGILFFVVAGRFPRIGSRTEPAPKPPAPLMRDSWDPEDPGPFRRGRR